MIAEAEFYQDKRAKHRCRVYLESGELLFASTQGYFNESDCYENFEDLVVHSWKWDQVNGLTSDHGKIASIETVNSGHGWMWRFAYTNGNVGGRSFKLYDRSEDCVAAWSRLLLLKWNIQN